MAVFVIIELFPARSRPFPKNPLNSRSRWARRGTESAATPGIHSSSAGGFWRCGPFLSVGGPAWDEHIFEPAAKKNGLIRTQALPVAFHLAPCSWRTCASDRNVRTE